MNSTAAFLKHVLPDEGWYAAFVLETKRHIWFTDREALARTILERDASDQTIYHTCASFRERGKRNKENALSAKSFWLDIDLTPKSKYGSVHDAAEAVSAFCQATGLPTPVYVASGHGLHIYWPLDIALGPDEWRAYAGGLKRLCAKENLDAGPERTSDVASILRTPGTHNRKGGQSVLVECGPLVGPYPVENFARLLDEQPATRAVGQRPPLAHSLAATFDSEPRSAESIADVCKQLGDFRTAKGRLAEPIWYAGLGVIAYCNGAEQTAHEWSNGHPNYTYEETQERLKRVKTLSGATTCQHFHSLNPKVCEACPHWQKIKSPISLGRSQNTAQKSISDSFFQANGHKLNLPALPDDFFWRNDGALITKSGSQRGDIDVVVSRYPVYLDAVQRGEVRGEFNLIFKQHLPERGWLDISLPSRSIFGHGSGAELADRGANIHEHTHFIRYVRGAIDQLYGTNKLSMRYDQFGWKQDDTHFLYGLDLYGPDGASRVMGNDELQVRCKEDWVGPCKGGDLEVWKQTVNALFAQGCEPQSVALLASFAAPLMRFQERDEGGAIIHLVTRESGTGKSTALIGAASVWGRREGLGLTNDDTRISKALTLGALGNLPLIYDEITLRDPEAIRAFVINFTNGRDKMRATRGGEIKHTASTWQTILISAANSSLVDTLSTQNTPEAPAWRVMEFGLELPEGLRHAQGDKLRRTLRANSGHAGKVFLEWLVQPTNLAWTKSKLEQITQQVWERTGWRSEHRFWVRTIAAIAVAGVVVKQLGLVEFSIDRILTWLFDSLHATKGERIDWAVPAISEFLNQSVGCVLVVPGPYELGHKMRPIVEPRLRLTIRYELSSNRYLIAASALREWLVKRELSFQALVKELERLGIVTRRRAQVTLGAGTDFPTGQIWAVEINAAHESISGISPVKGESNVVLMQPRVSL